MKSMKIDEINGKAIIRLEKAGRIEWVVARDYEENAQEGTKWSSGQYFSTLYDAVAYAEKKDTFYQLLVYLDTVDDFEPSHFFYIFHSFEEALEKAKEVINNEGLDKSLIKDLEKDWTADYGDCGMISIEEYYMGERIS